MKKPKRYSLYDRNEIFILGLMALFAGLLAFTVGIHFGKELGLLSAETGTSPESETATKLEAAQENVPSQEELDARYQGIDQSVAETLTRALQEEVAKTGIRMDVPRQVELPTEAKSEKLAKHLKSDAEPKDKLVTESSALKVARRTETDFAKSAEGTSGGFTLQVGSFPEAAEAAQRVKALEEKGLTAFSRKIDIRGKGDWFRVYVGGFTTSQEAEKFGAEKVHSGVLESFLVVRSVAPSEAKE